jgi:predicted transcriptional regulator
MAILAYKMPARIPTPAESLPTWAVALKQRRAIELSLSQEEIALRTNGSLHQLRVSRAERGHIHPTKDLSSEELWSLIKSLEWSGEEFEDATGLKIPGFQRRTKSALDEALEAMTYLEADIDWVPIEVVGVVDANFDDTVQNKSLNKVAMFPRDKLKGSDLKKVKAYFVNGDCMISDEARRMEKSIAPGDYIAVELGRPVEVGEVVVGWWVKKRKMIVKRFGLDGDKVLLYPTNKAHPVLEMQEDEFVAIGKFLARAG